MKRYMLYTFVLTISYPQGLYSQNTCTICDTLKNNIVKIHATFDDGSDENGFGFVIAERSNKLYIVTAKHVVYDLDGNGIVSLENRTKSVAVKFLSDLGRDYTVTLLSLPNTTLDITLLETNKPENYSWQKDFYSATIQRGIAVWFIGRAGEWYIPTGSFIGSVNSISADDEILIDINSIQPGTSGAPLISQNGIVGLIFEDAASGAKAYPIEKVKRLITETWHYSWQMNLNRNVIATDGTTKGCSISGKVFNEDTNQPLSAVQIYLYDYQENPRTANLRIKVATTGLDGSFKFDCQGVANSSFSAFEIVLWNPNWSAFVHTMEKIELGDTRTDVNIPVSNAEIQ